MALKKILALAAIVAVAAILFFQWQGNSKTGLATAGNLEEGTITIGFLSAFTGDAAPWGEGVKAGAELAFDEINNEKINGKQLKLVFEDDKCDAKTGLSAVNKVINVDNAKITTGTVCSSVVLAAAPVFEKNKVIHLSLGASNPAITSAGEYIFRIWPSDSFEGAEIARFAAKKLSAKNIGILYINNDYGVGLRDAFAKEFESNGGKIKSAESFEVNAKDFRTQLEKIKASGIDAIFFASNPKEAPVILKQIKELGINATILANGPAIQATDTLSNAGSTAEGVFFAQAKQSVNEEFGNKFKEKFGKEQDFLANIGYDGIMLLFKAIKACGSDNSDCIKQQLYNTQGYNGVSAAISFDKNGDVIVPFEIKKISSGTVAAAE